MSDDNFSSIPAGSQRGFNSSARIFRLAWLFCVNGFIALFTLWRLRGAALVAFTGQPEFQPWLIFQTTFEFVFEVCLPIAGVVFEVARRKFAQRINVGTFVVAGGFWLGAGGFVAAGAVFW